MPHKDTIVALSSGALPSGVAVIRMSGPSVRAIVRKLVGRLPEPRRAVYSAIRDLDGSILDRGIILFFAAPSTVTGEDIAEFHLHGGRATVAAVLAELTSHAGVRLADAGEFTRRAFLNGRMDLTEVEALSDLIAAETESQRLFALANSGGSQRQLYESWRARIVRARALIEAELDFADEEDVPGSASDAVWSEAESLGKEISNHISGYRRGEIIRSGYDVVIAGPPNVGKSSLINALAKRDVAIVSDLAGTTRDLIEVNLDLDGIKVRVTDTAGLRQHAEAIEALGIERARSRIDEADLVLAVSDSGDWVGWDETDQRIIRVRSKQDVPEVAPNRADVAISVKSDLGLDDLISLITDRARLAAGSHNDVLPSRVRHLNWLQSCQTSLQDAANDRGAPIELRAEALRQAGDALGRLTGKVDVEDLLDVIFSEFCIGK